MSKSSVALMPITKILLKSKGIATVLKTMYVKIAYAFLLTFLSLKYLFMIYLDVKQNQANPRYLDN